MCSRSLKERSIPRGNFSTRQVYFEKTSAERATVAKFIRFPHIFYTLKTIFKFTKARISVPNVAPHVLSFVPEICEESFGCLKAFRWFFRSKFCLHIDVETSEFAVNDLNTILHFAALFQSQRYLLISQSSLPQQRWEFQAAPWEAPFTKWNTVSMQGLYKVARSSSLEDVQTCKSLTNTPVFIRHSTGEFLVSS